MPLKSLISRNVGNLKNAPSNLIVNAHRFADVKYARRGIRIIFAAYLSARENELHLAATRINLEGLDAFNFEIRRFNCIFV